MTGKGVAITSYEPRGSMKDALDLAMTAVGEIHGDRGAPERMILDSLTNCAFWRRYVNKIFGDLAGWAVPMLEATCGWQYSPKEWEDLVMRSFHLERCYSIREGYLPSRDDVMPERFFEETIHNKYGEPKILDHDEFLEKRKERYLSYGLREDGTPSADTLEDLGLGFTVEAVEEALDK